MSEQHPAPPLFPHVDDAARQQQFLNVVSRDEAERRFHAHLRLAPLGTESVSLYEAHGRALAADIIAPIDVPGFDRSNVDGFAVRSIDVAGAMEESPRYLQLNNESIVPGTVPAMTVASGTATPIATGAMIPRGADAVLMIEHSDLIQEAGSSRLVVTRAVPPGTGISYSGSDIALGETVLWSGQILTSREIGVIAALGLSLVPVCRPPRVSIISTGDEIVPPGAPLPAGHVYDSNGAILASIVREQGGIPIVHGRIADDETQLQQALDAASESDMIVLSGGTSKGAGDYSYRVVSRLCNPGIVAHGVSLKPGKPICLAVTHGKPVVVLPGFPTSAVFTFHEFVVPVIRRFAGLPIREPYRQTARLPMRVHSERGRTEYTLVRLFNSTEGLKAYPIGKGSGSVTTFSQADGFITIPQHSEQLEAGEQVEITMLDRELKSPDLVIIGSHCLGLDIITRQLHKNQLVVSTMSVGSQGGIAAAAREECDLAGIHLLDPVTKIYNTSFVPDNCVLIPGYQRRQCLMFRTGDERFQAPLTDGTDAASSPHMVDNVLMQVVTQPDCLMVNRNAGSGTRILIDQLLQRICPGHQPAGYGMQVRSHNSVAAAILQRRADWGIGIETVARQYGLSYVPWIAEHYDFLMPRSRQTSPALLMFQKILNSTEVRKELEQNGFFTD